MQKHGEFVWYELMTSDAKAATAFYRKVVGWDIQDMPMPGMTYTILKVGDVAVSGLMALTDEMKQRGVPPCWTGYVEVDDVDKTVGQITSLGGAVHMAPHDIPDVGRFAIVADPQGAVFALIRTANRMDQALAPATPGGTGWHELYTTDWPKALDFYGKIFGWKKGQSMDMGPGMGTYQIFDFEDRMLGGMMSKPPNVPVPVPVPAWVYYVNVDNIDAAAKRTKDNGGQVVLDPMEVPGGMWVLQGTDPQGALFALIGPKG